jgi:lipoprotein signal peptidase
VTRITLREYRRQLNLLATVALAVIVLDLATKQLAGIFLAETVGDSHSLLGFSFFLTRNEGTAGGVSLGDGTRLFNMGSMILPVLFISMIEHQLLAMHRLAALAFGLIAGAALGNVTSLAISSGVVDFIAFDTAKSSIVFNIADVASFAGIAALVPVAVSLVGRIRLDRRSRRVRGVARRRTVAPRRARQAIFEREVPLARASEIVKDGIAAMVLPAADRPATTSKDSPGSELRA